MSDSELDVAILATPTPSTDDNSRGVSLSKGGVRLAYLREDGRRPPWRKRRRRFDRSRSRDDRSAAAFVRGRRTSAVGDALCSGTAVPRNPRRATAIVACRSMALARESTRGGGRRMATAGCAPQRARVYALRGRSRLLFAAHPRAIRQAHRAIRTLASTGVGLDRAPSRQYCARYPKLRGQRRL